MNAKDLMIGDWVNLCGTPCRVKDIVNDGVINYEKDVIPIPLTEEILKKNGFLINSNGIFYLKENLKFGFKKDFDYGYWFINRADNYKEYICTCDFVHELQHILKLQQIEKEIIL